MWFLTNLSISTYYQLRERERETQFLKKSKEVTVDNPIQYWPSPSYRMLSGMPGRYSINFSTFPLSLPCM